MNNLDNKYTGLLNSIYDVLARNDAGAIDKLKLDDFYIDYDNETIVFVKDGVFYDLRLSKSYAPAPAVKMPVCETAEDLVFNNID